MRSNEVIKAGLACHARSRRYMLECDGCGYNGAETRSCTVAVHEDALALISKLEREKAELFKELAPLCICEICKHEKQEPAPGCVLADFECKVCSRPTARAGTARHAARDGRGKEWYDGN